MRDHAGICNVKYVWKNRLIKNVIKSKCCITTWNQNQCTILFPKVFIKNCFCSVLLIMHCFPRALPILINKFTALHTHAGSFISRSFHRFWDACLNVDKWDIWGMHSIPSSLVWLHILSPFTDAIYSLIHQLVSLMFSQWDTFRAHLHSQDYWHLQWPTCPWLLRTLQVELWHSTRDFCPLFTPCHPHRTSQVLRLHSSQSWVLAGFFLRCNTFLHQLHRASPPAPHHLLPATLSAATQAAGRSLPFHRNSLFTASCHLLQVL